MTAYYVDATSGDDSKDGLTTATAWKTMNKISNFAFAADDVCYLKYGEVWRETWYINIGGSTGHPVNYDAYGNSALALPRVTGCDLLTGWSAETVPTTGLFSDGFESGDISAWSTATNPGGQLTVTAGAALVGTKGLNVAIAGQVHAFVQDNTPANETTYRCRFYLDPNSLTMAANDEFIIARALNSAVVSVWFVKLQRQAGTYKLFIFVRDDAFVGQSAQVTISDAPHYVECYWKSSTAPGANNGIFQAWVDGTLTSLDISNLDSDTLSIDQVRMGAELELDAGTSGAMFFDAFYSNNTGSPIGATDPTTPVPFIYKASYTNSIDTFLLLEDNVMLTEVANKGAISAAGEFYGDDVAHIIYVRTLGSDDPTGHVMEVGGRYDAVNCDDRQHIEFRNIHFHGAGGQFGRGFGLKPTWNTPADITLRNCQMSRCFYTGAWVAYANTFSAIDGFKMYNCEVDHNYTFGLHIEGQDAAHRIAGVRLDACLIHDNGDPVNGQQGIFINHCVSPIVTLCTIYDNSGGLDWSDNLLIGDSTDAETSYDLIHGGNHSGIHYDVNSYGVIKYNRIYDCAWNGIWVEEHQTGAGNVSVICGNTTYNCLHGLTFGPGSTIFEVSGVTAKNNLFAFSKRANVELNEDNANPSYLNNTLDYNLYWVNTADPQFLGEFRAQSSRVNLTFAQWKAYTSWDAHSIDANPLLTDGAGHDFTLTATSPARNAGITLPAIYEAALNPNGGTATQSINGNWEIGAYLWVEGLRGDVKVSDAQISGVLVSDTQIYDVMIADALGVA